jgi:hypothetical protein
MTAETRRNSFIFGLLLLALTSGCLPRQRQSGSHAVREEISAGMIFVNFHPHDKRQIREAASSLFTGRCTEAFIAAGLRSPSEVVLESRVVFRPSIDLYLYAARQLGLRYEQTRRLYKSEFSSGNAQAGTINPVLYGQRLTFDDSPRIFLHPTAFDESILFGRRQLREVLIHEFIHAGGQPPKPGWLGSLRHDLAGFAPYNRIMKACR